MDNTNEKKLFREWITHSYFSFLNGASSPKQLISRAIKLGYKSITIADLDGVYGLARAYREVCEFKKKGQFITLHYGTEIHLSPDHHLPMMLQNTVILVAQSHKGYETICQLLTSAHRQGKNTAWLSPHDLSIRNLSDVVAIIPMRGLLRQNRSEEWHTQLEILQRVFGPRLYLAITSLHHPGEDAWITQTITTAEERSIPLLISQDVFFHHPNQKRIADTLTAIRLNRTLDDSTAYLWPNSQRCLRPIPSILKRYRHLNTLETALENSEKLAQSIQFDFSELRYKYPQEFIPDSLKKKSSPTTTITTAMDYLKSLVWERAYIHYQNHIPESVQNMISHELSLVETLDFPDYFLTVYDIVRWARSQNILCQGRGSAANSVICFLLGITALDPTQFDLLFERFISVERGDPPDIDVDFEHERREEVIQYIYSRFGRHRAAMVCNVITFKSRGAIRSVGLALGVPEKILSATATLLNSRHFRRAGTSTVLAEIQTDFPNEIPSHTWVLWAELSDAIRGFPRHLGIHSGGFIISQHPITALSPIEPATMVNRTVIQWSKEDIEALGFFKIDVLALGGLTLIRKCLHSIRTLDNVELSMATIPANDPDTFEMIRNADTIGTFQIESRAQMSFLPRHLPMNFYDLVVQVAIIRPGPIQGGMIHPYLRRRRGEEPVTFPDPRLIPILKRTFGVPIFQEQVMRVAIAVGGFSPGEADELRKNIGAFSLNLEQSEWIQRLRNGMESNGITSEFIDSIMGHIHGFASYGFPESHAASFALLAYITAYLKCHYPAHFFASILNSLPMGFYSPDILIKTAQKAKVKVLPICIGHSRWDHHLEQHNGSWAIRLGYRLIHGIRKSSALQLETEQTPLRSIADLIRLLSYSKLNQTDLTALAAANAFHSLGISRGAAIWLAEASPLRELLDHLGDSPTLIPETPLEAVQLDYASTGTSLGLHPAALMRTYAWPFQFSIRWLTFSTQIPTLKHNTVVTIFGLVTVRQSPPTAKGMVFITLWDETGCYDLIVRPNIYSTYRHIIDRQTFLCVRGKIQIRENVRSIIVTSVLDGTLKYPISVHFPKPEFDEQVRNYM